MGMAIAMYTNDNSGYTPAQYGVDYWNVDSNGNYFNALDDPRGLHFGIIDKWDQINNMVLAPNTVPWHINEVNRGIPNGLGLLYASGYLTQKGAQVLYCPSNNSNSRASYADSVNKGVPQGMPISKLAQYDKDEPFWTSKGTVRRGNENALGDSDGRWFMGWAQNCWANYAIANSFSRWYDEAHQGICHVMNNYTIRFWSDASKGVDHVNNYPDMYWYPNAQKVEEVGKAAVVADLQWYIAAAKYEPIGEIWVPLYGPLSNALRPHRTEILAEAHQWEVTNHAAAYNLLFADGSVKSYGDPSYNILWSYILAKADNLVWWGPESEPPAVPVDAMDKAIWRSYLDTAYLAD
jgi:prepilin-type processing-associated H-X9-DG protein